LTILTVAIGFPLSFALVPLFGIIGLIVTTILVGIPSMFLGLRYINKNFGVSVDWVSSAKIMLSSVAAGVLTYAAISQLPFSNVIQLIIGVFVFVVAFVLLAVGTGTLNKSDLVNVREIGNAMGPLRKPLTIVLNLIEKLMNIANSD
jgi:peptidoglycan biosynthesis protein MviN/MurJ (putative lipid II flippase)